MTRRDTTIIIQEVSKQLFAGLAQIVWRCLSTVLSLTWALQERMDWWISKVCCGSGRAEWAVASTPMFSMSYLASVSWPHRQKVCSLWSQNSGSALRLELSTLDAQASSVDLSFPPHPPHTHHRAATLTSLSQSRPWPLLGFALGIWP